MLRLTDEQQQALEALALRRDLARVGVVLGKAFPDIDARLGERKPALVEFGWQKAGALGLTHGLAVARYLAAWFVFGAAFETKPGFEWAMDLLAQPQRSEGQRVFQLGRRIREELRHRPHLAAEGLRTPEAFDTALATVDAELVEQGRLGSLSPRARLALGSACDLDAFDLAVVEPTPQRLYAMEPGGWRRVPAVVDPQKLRLVSIQGQERLPPQINLLSGSEGRSRLRLRCRAAHVCDPAVHPLVNFNGVHGQYDRRGPQTRDLEITLPLQAQAPQAFMAMEDGASHGRLTIAACGLRDSGQPMGEQGVHVAAYPAGQTLLAWRREASPAVHLPADPVGPAPPVHCRLERDGGALDTGRWTAGLAELDRQLASKLPALLIAWEREAGVVGGSLQAEPSLMAGDAALTWGWAPHPDGLAAPPYHRVGTVLDLVVCQLGLRLGGELSLSGATSQLHLRCDGRATLQVQAWRGPLDENPKAVLQPAQVEFRLPFVLHLENFATPGLAMLDQVGQPSGAVVGAAGLRPHPSGAGLQWFCRVAIEEAAVLLNSHDPLLGQQRHVLRPLLPAMTLVDWSLD